MCPSHYQRWRQLDPSRPECSKEGCNAKLYAKALCRKHYSAIQLAGYWQRPDVVERHRAADRRWYEENREHVAAYSRSWRKANASLTAEHRRSWRRDNPERNRELGRQANSVRKARMLAVQTEPVDYAAILAEHGMFCHICSLVIVDESDLHFDHVIPLALGGPHSQANIKPAHALCNLRKGASLL
jgi:5-methylcytosine-specific restriction endonuclease McrA